MAWACTHGAFLSLLQLNYKDCEKAVKKHHIDGPRFLVSAARPAHGDRSSSVL